MSTAQRDVAPWVVNHASVIPPDNYSGQSWHRWVHAPIKCPSPSAHSQQPELAEKPIEMSALKGLNTSPQDPPTVPISPKITINVLPGTDLWRKPPSTNSINAPAYVEYRPIKQFKRARVTVKSDWNRLYDQGGLIFLINSPGHEGERYESWVKTGIEQFDGKPNVGTVAAPAGGYADWSLVPVSSGSKSVTLEVTPELNGPTLYVHLVDGEKKTLIREVTWVFQEKHDGLLGVGVYAARPTKVEGETDSNGEALPVHFEGLEIEWSN